MTGPDRESNGAPQARRFSLQLFHAAGPVKRPPQRSLAPA
jgi:hypothetical protein